MVRKLLIILVVGLLLVGCGEDGGNEEAEVVETAVSPATATVAQVEATEGLPPTEMPTAVSVEPTDSPTAESEPQAFPTVIQATATFTPALGLTGGIDPGLPLAPSVNLEQPPYAESACSDKYPCNDDEAAWESRIQVPEDFEVTNFAFLDGVQPTAITFGPDGLLYVASQAGTIYTVDQGGETAVFMEGFDTPTGLAFQPGTSKLFVSDRLINENTGGESQISVIQNGEVTQLFGGIPCCYTYLHAANGIAFGPDGFGYVSVGARADHGEILPGNDNAGEQDDLHPWEASILRFSPDGSIIEPYARGLRNAYDLAWDGEGRLFATDNAPDFGPPDEFHLITPGGEHGYPWYDCGQCFSPPEGVEVIPPLYEFPPHSAVTGVTSYLSDGFPGYYNNLFVVLWSAFADAQRVMRFEPGGVGASTFATGFAAPVDLTVGPDGALYVADWATGIVFRIDFVGS